MYVYMYIYIFNWYVCFAHYTAMDKLHEEIDNLNLVLDHLERKNGDIYMRIEELLMSFQQNKSESE